MYRNLAALALILAGASAHAENASTLDAIKIAAGQSLFDAECHRCHAPNSVDPSYGPSLVNVLGRKAGTVEAYDYSEALEEAGFVWTAGALIAWMEDNDGFLPGTKMRHVGIEDPTAQDFVLAYLTSISQ